MKTLEQLYSYKGGKDCNFIDSRDKNRLITFIPAKFGFMPAEGIDPKTIQTEAFTKENVLKYLKIDLSFAFDKALGRLGISSSLMWDVIKMWMWVLDDDLADFPDSRYAQYGLPLYKAVAVKYGLNNPIGEDCGAEQKYASE